MGWFAQRQAFESNAQVVVFGHTHMPISGLDTTLVQYVNSGFECPAIPDMLPRGEQVISFVLLDLDTQPFTARVLRAAKIGDAIEILPCAAPTTPIVRPPFADFSTYVLIDNPGTDSMRLVGAQANHGYWVVPPPEEIPARGQAMLWLQDYPGARGSEGSCSYTSSSLGHQVFTFSCPLSPLSANTASGGSSFRTKSGTGSWLPPGRVAKSGHPFYVEFTA